ncbi:BatA domain-containing protein [Rhodopirellula sp.]|nr:BatA domain-containing protein [Rhodopirellula sp.]
MSFLQPAMLIALPLIALPIVIHLINQRRFQTVQWGAMQFLLAANRMSRGYARIRQWLILAARTLAIAALIFAISRPLSSGWLGVAGGGQVDTTIILIDRSPSMTQTGPGGISKLDAGLEKLVDSLETLSGSRYVLIDSVNEEPAEFEEPADLLQMPEVLPVSASADLPSLLEATDRYIRENRPSRAEVWMLSDVRRNDWKDDSGRWDAIRESLIELPQMVRFHLLAYPEMRPGNRSLTVSQVRRVEDGDATKLLISLRINRDDAQAEVTTVPVSLELNGAKSVFDVEVSGTGVELVDHPVMLGEGTSRGWGRVSIPADGTASDNEFYFVFDKQPPRKTLVVSDDPTKVRPIEFAAAISPDAAVVCESTSVTPDDLIAQDLETVALIAWHVAIPSEDDPLNALLNAFVQRGGQLIFFPPKKPANGTFAGVGWGTWQEPQVVRVGSWVGDQDLLTRTRSGDALPVGELRVTRHCDLVGEFRSLAVLDGGAPLIARATTDRGGAFFCTTTTSPADSSFASAGVVLYAMIQRAGEAGAMMLASTKQTIAGEFATNETQEWEQLAGSTDGLSSTYSSTAGIYQGQGKLLAINRSEGEDASTIVPEERVEMLFANLDFDRVNQTADNDSSLIQEVWRLFLILVLVALIGEAFLCIPKRVTVAVVSGEFKGNGPTASGFANSNAGSNSENVSVGGAV